MAGIVTVINHASVLIQLDGVNVLTDPIYSRTVSFLFPRLQRPGIALEDLPPIDAVLVSHSDYDHLNLKTLKQISRRHAAPIVLPAGLGPYGQSAGFINVVEMTAWQTIEHGRTSITCVPAKHLSKRRPGDPTSNACVGYVIQAGGHTVYFAGDTAYDGFFAEIGSRFSIDVALLPIGAYKPERWFKNLHLHPSTALQAFLDLKARLLVPIHWGTFWISDEPMAEPPHLLREEASRRGCAGAVHVLRNGEALRF